MNSIDAGKFANILGSLAVIAAVELNEVTIDTFFKALKDFSIEEIERAGNYFVATWGERRLPTPSHFREFLQGGNIEQQAQAALDICINNSTYDHSVKFSDPAIMVAVERIGGWEQWCDWVRWTPEDEFHWKRKEWVKHYMAAKKSGSQPSTNYFVGYIQAQSQRNDGYGEPLLHMVGDGGQCEIKSISGEITSMKQIRGKVDEEGQ